MLAVTGCGNTAEESKESSTVQVKESESTPVSSSTQEASEEGVAIDAFAGTELTIVVTKNAFDQSEDYNDTPAFKAAEEATGIHINWVELESGSAGEKRNLMLASPDQMPDAFYGGIGQSTIAKNMDLFYDLSEEGLLETYAPDILADYEQMIAADGLEALRWDDGSIRSLYMGLETSQEGDPQGITVINQEWLDKVGMDKPTTADDLFQFYYGAGFAGHSIFFFLYELLPEDYGRKCGYPGKIIFGDCRK